MIAHSTLFVTTKCASVLTTLQFFRNSNKNAILQRAVALQLRMLNAGFGTCHKHEGIQLPGLGIAVGLA